MLKLQDRISAWSYLGNVLQAFFRSDPGSHSTWEEELARIVNTTVHHNGWFEKEQVLHALKGWADLLAQDKLEQWVQEYEVGMLEPSLSRKVGIVMAGNIPLVGLHDLICVTLSGHEALIKLSSDDDKLIPHLLLQLGELKSSIQIEDRLNNVEAVIATGSDNTARYFEHYFGKYPNVIRKNRKSVAILTGEESEQDIVDLGEDVFRYYGLGCRSVSKLYIPEDFDLNRIFGAWMPYQDVILNNKYANNYDYHRALLLLDREPFLENGFVVFRENERLATPVSVIHYERYSSVHQIEEALIEDRAKLQCVVGNVKNERLPIVGFGQTQHPELHDYADGVDTLSFLGSL